MHQKSEEVVALKGVVELERSRVEALSHELRSCKEDCEKWTREASSWKTRSLECSSRLDEVSRSLEVAQETVHSQKEELMLLRHDSKHGQDSYHALQANLQSKEEAIASLQNELRAVKDDNAMLRHLTDGVEGTSRENEKLKASLASLQSDMSVLELKYEHLQETHSSMESEIAQREKRIGDLRSEVEMKIGTIDELSAAVNDHKVSMSEAKSRCVALEAALSEHRSISASLQSELDNLKEDKKAEERRFSDEGNRLLHARSDFGKTCSVVIHALLKWDKVLMLAMESFDVHDQESSLGLMSRGRRLG